MAATESPDVILNKALRLLHSRTKDSAGQLKSLLDEVLAHKSSKDVKYVENTIKRPAKLGIETAVIKSSKDVKKELEKKPDKTVDKVKTEKTETPTTTEKRLTVESPQNSRSTSSSPISGSNSSSSKAMSEDRSSVKVEEDSEATDIEEESTDAAEFASLLELACVICKQIDQNPGNQLVECQECHKLYHQECHKPAVADQEVSDPRVVWYCAKCQKAFKKMATKPSKNNKTTPPATSSTSPLAALKEMTQTTKTPVKSESVMQPFKRVEPKVPVSPIATTSSATSSTSNKPIVGGLAAFAAMSRSTGASKAKANNNNGSATATGSTTNPSDKKLLVGKKQKNIKK